MFRFLLWLFLPILILTLQSHAQEFNDIDAISSASGKYRITGGKAYSGNAELKYQWRYGNGTMSIKWGTTSSMTDGSQSIPVFPVSGTIDINSLEPNTKYNFQLYGTWAGYNYPNLGKGTFTTASDGTISFVLTVESGNGSGEYEEGEEVTIKANNPSSGKEFDKWTGDIGSIEDVSSSTTVVTMPAEDVAVSATYKDIIIDKYTLTVESGSGSGEYEEGDVIDISANDAPSGKEFDKWTGDVSSVGDVNSINTKVTMPASDVSITATYKDVIIVEKYALTVESGTGSGDYEEGEMVTIKADSPESGKVFDKWTGDISHVEDVNSDNTKVTMPSEDIAIAASYKDEIVEPVNDNYLKYVLWDLEIDDHGSSVDIDTSEIETKGFSANINLNATVDTNYTWAKVSGYDDGDFSEVTEITLRYTSDKSINIILEQAELSEAGIAYQYKLVAATDTQVTIPISSFNQPSWVENEPDLQKPLDLAKVLGISFAAIEENSETNIRVELIFLKGYEGTPIFASIDGIGKKKNVMIQNLNKEKMVLSLGKAGSYKVSLFSLSGRRLFSNVIDFKSEVSSIIDLKSASLSNGVHLLNISDNKNSYTLRAIIK